MNILVEHLEGVVNPCWNYAGRCEEWKDHVMNATLGLVGEAGELADQHKKMFFHTEKDYNFHLEKIKYELGDVAFYFIKLIELHGLTLEEVLEGNKAKLESRHPELGKVEERFGEGHIG